MRTCSDLREEIWGGMGPNRAGFDLRLSCCREEVVLVEDGGMENKVLVWVKQL